MAASTARTRCLSNRTARYLAILGLHKVPCLLREPVIASSACRHGVSDETILHAFKNHIRAKDLDEGFTMLTGPDHAGNLFEVGVVVFGDVPVIVHAMPARPKFRR